ncbi:hypothetical protein TraAM80_01659 [Trypanosoma rangeli]|uniref:Uncharacterized protein n=1 Tax=Trypanosoma rangeli TaxID=5698 RepID=A0A3R7KM54_TRYRA|nr:uncharacterized protein TraAM80_01659 [Trypanosoma rangeli]RNF10220.1 hypothetical protein TraAM80_01659 [Trypanosoma rangeli]|eukprot:RNF10220.1 hypothetical protein TraAM80_01659 [Trypanosoma rangeli]
MSTARATSGSSVFTVLYAPTNGSARRRRRWLCGRMYVGFDRTVLVDDESQKAVYVVSGTGIRPNTGYAMMQEAGNGAEWHSGTELALPRYAVQIEEVMHLHLLPYAPFDGSGKKEVVEQNEAASPPYGDGSGDCRTVTSAREEADAAGAVTPCHATLRTVVVPTAVPAAGTVILKKRRGSGPPPRRSSQELLQQLENAYPHFFA